MSMVPQDGYDVLGCYMSPVNDAYWKQMLAPGRHRVRMCQLATADSGALPPVVRLYLGEGCWHEGEKWRRGAC